MRLERPEGTEATMAGHSPVMGRSAATKKRFSFGGEGGVVWALMRILRSLIATAVLAALAALFIQMARKPDGIPAPQTGSEVQATQLYQSLKAFSQTVYPRAIDVTQAQANNYLAVRLVPSGDGSGLRAQFVRAFVVIESGNARFYVEQKFLGLPVYMYLTAVPEGSAMKVTGGGLGRVNLPAQLVPVLQRNLQSIIDSTPDAAEILSKASAIEFKSGAAKVTWQGTKAPGN